MLQVTFKTKMFKLKNANDLIGGLSFKQLVQIVKPFLWDGPIIGYDFIVFHGEDEQKLLEYHLTVTTVKARTGVAELVTQS